MNLITGRIRQHYIFFIGYLLFLLPSLLILFFKSKRDIFLLLNSYHTNWLDNFFIYYTNAGDGLFAVLLSFFFFFILKKKKVGLILLIAYCATGIFAQIIKPLVESPRPQVYFSPAWFPFFIRDVIHIGNNSFPSGHTTTAFAIATVLTLYTSNKWYHFSLLLLAVLAGYSRIYLSQHFLADVVAGSFIGVVGGILCVYCCRNITDDRLKFKKK